MRVAGLIVVAAVAAFPAYARAADPCASDKGDGGSCETRRPSVGIVAEPSTPHAGASVTLKASGTGRELQLAWDLDGDGAFDDATGAQVTHAFAASTTIGVRATDEDGRTASETRTLAVSAGDLAPTGQLSTAPAAPRAGADVHVLASGTDPDGTLARIEVDADGDGTYEATGGDTVVRFATPGARTLRARLIDDGGNVTTVTDAIDVHAGNVPPITTLDVQPASPKVGQAVTLSALASDADGDVAHYDYDLDGNGSFETPGAAFGTTTTYAGAGTREIGVRVTDDGGATAIAKTSVAVRDGNEPPVAWLRRTAATRTLFASGVDADGGAGTYDWDLDGDGAFDDASGFILNYAAIPGTGLGTFDVGVRIADGEGATSVSRRAVAIHDLPATVPSITVSPAQPRAGQTVTFDAATLSDDLTSVSWDLDGDGTFSGTTSDDWLHQTTSYANAGTRTVQVKVTDRQNRTATARVEVVVSPAAGNLVPGAAFSASTDWPQTGATVTFTDTSSDDGTIASRAWDLDGDGAFDDGTDATVTRSFPSAGNRLVALRVTDDQGATATQRRTLEVHDGNLLPRAVIAGDGALLLRAGEAATLQGSAAAGGDDDVAYAWDADDDGAFDDGTAAALPVSFATAGFHRVRLRVTDAADAQDVATLLVDVRPAGAEHSPALSLTVPPGIVRPNTAASFSAFAADAENDPITLAWDLDGDGDFDDATGASVSRAYAVPGAYVVRVRASDDGGGVRTVARTVNVVGDADLSPAFSSIVMPPVVRAGRATTFSIWAFDPDVSTGGVGPRGVTLSFDLNGDGDFDDVPLEVPGAPVATYTWTFPTTAPVTIAVRARDVSNRTSVATLQVHPTAANSAPVAGIFAPTAIAGRPALFSANASDPDGATLAYAWDADGDGDYDDGASLQLLHTFATPGAYTVGLRVTDGDGKSTDVRRTFTVGTAAPVASFDASSTTPAAGDAVTLSSTASDPDGGALASQRWDLDDDGAFDDATGATATVTFPDAGARRVGLKVSDAGGDLGIRYVQLSVAAAPVVTPAATPTPTATPAPGGKVRIAETPPLRLSATVKAPKRSAHSLAVKVGCTATCRATVVVKLGSHVLGRATGKGGTITVKFSAKARRLLSHTHSRTLTVTISAPGAKSAKKTLTIRR